MLMLSLPLSFFMSLSVSLCFSVSTCVSLCLRVSFWICVCLSMSRCVFLSLSLRSVSFFSSLPFSLIPLSPSLALPSSFSYSLFITQTLPPPSVSPTFDRHVSAVSCFFVLLYSSSCKVPQHFFLVSFLKLFLRFRKKGLFHHLFSFQNKRNTTEKSSP